jgi:hypothetical protein
MKILFDTKVSDRTKNRTDTAIRFFLDILVPSKMLKGVEIDIEFDPKLDCIGEVYLADHEYNKVRPTKFDLKIRHKQKHLIETIAHECVHIKQYITGELTIGENVKKISIGGANLTLVEEYLRWNQEDWVPDNDDDSHWYDSPWEIEAYGRENGLLKKWEKREKR